MRKFSVALLVGAVLAGSMIAQQPMAPITPQEAAALDQILRGWEKAMTDLRSFATVVDRESLDKALQARDKYQGYALFLKAATKDDHGRACLVLQKEKKAEVFEKYICTGTYLYEYLPAQKVIRVHDLPEKKKGVQQESFLSFLFGMGADEAKARYEMRPVTPAKNDPTAPYYHYLRIKPKTAADKNDFTEARLSLYKSNNLPAQIWYLQPNGNEITWTFTKVQVDKQISLDYFQPTQEKDWRVERAPAKLAPTARGKQ